MPFPQGVEVSFVLLRGEIAVLWESLGLELALPACSEDIS
jgi:hypothetical protein